MEKFELHILGCGSAQPTLRHNPSSQVLNIHNKIYMVDCGEGSQIQLRRARLSFSRLNHVFISHLHGDHCFGVIGMISTFALKGRTAPLHIFSPAEFEGLLQPLLAFHCRDISFDVVFHPFDCSRSEQIFEDRTITVTTIPLRHRVPCCGFVFREKPSLPNIRRDMIDFHHIPVCEINNIKRGADWVKPDGTIVPNAHLVTPPKATRSYAYMSDTAFVPENAKYVEGVSLLFHEATFATQDAARAATTCHSTAAQAAQMASLANVGRLCIGHYSSRYDDENVLLQESRDVFPETYLTDEGLVFQV